LLRTHADAFLEVHDGRYTREERVMAGRPRTLTDVNLRARWVEASCIRLKRDGTSFREIARLLTAAGCGDSEVLGRLPEPEGFTFPFDYRISAKACHKAFRKAMYRLPLEEAAETHRLNLDRLEEMYSKLVLGIERGDLASILAALRILERRADIFNHQRHHI
jgi:hypothetical protein